MISLVILVVVVCGVIECVSLESRSAQGSIQLLKENPCELNDASFESVLAGNKVYGEDRSLGIDSMKASTRTGLSTTANFALGDDNMYHIERDGPILITGYPLALNSTLALISEVEHGRDIHICVPSLLVPPGNWSFYAPGRNVTIEVDVLTLEGHLHINVSGHHAPQFYDSNGNSSAASGVSFGDNGNDGESGKDGHGAGSIVVRARVVDVKNRTSSLTLSADGGNGGYAQRGGDGQKGQKGRSGTPCYNCYLDCPINGQCSCYGGPGEDGGAGGNGGNTLKSGNGGDGGVVLFMYEILRNNTFINVQTSVKGGSGAGAIPGGEPGAGGDGGPGGPGIYKACRKGECIQRVSNQGPPGKRGPPGMSGLSGGAGKNGDVGSANVSQVQRLCSEISPVATSMLDCLSVEAKEFL